MKLKIRRKKLKAQGQAQETGPLQTQVQVQSASASLPEGERQTPKEKQRKHQPKQQRRRRRRRLWQRQRKELNEPNACIHDPIQSHVHGPRSDHSEEQNDHENEHENENEHNPLYAGNSGEKIVSIGNGHDSHIDTDVRRNIDKNVGGSDANHVGISKNELEPYGHEEEEQEQEEEQQPLMNPKKEMLIIKEFSRTDQDRPEVIIPGAGDLKNVELDLDLDSNDELNSDRSESESGSEPIAGSDLDIDLNSNLDSNLDLNDGPTLLSGSQSLSLFPPIDTIETELQRSNSSITSPLGNYGADHYHNLNRNTSRNNIKQSDHSNGNSNGSDNIHINTHHTENRRLSMNTFAFTDSIATSKINNNSKSNHNHNHEHGYDHDHDHDSRNNNSNCNSNSFNNNMTKQMSISQNINNIIMNNFHNTAFVYIKPHANTKKTQQLVRLTLLDSINPFSYNYTDNDDVDDNNESNDDDDDDGRTGRIISEYDITADVIQNNNLVDKHYRLIAKYATGIRGSVSCRTKIQPNKFRSIFGEDLDTVLKERRIYNALEALSACACTPQLLNELWVEAEEFRLEKDDEPKHKHLKKVVEFDRGYCCGNLLIHNKNVYVINGFYMALRQSYIEPGSSIHAYVVQWNTPSSLSSSVRSTSLPSTLGSTTLQWHQFRDKVIGSTNPREAADGSLRKMIYDQYAELGIDLELRPTALNNAIHASASPLEGLAEQISWLQQDVSSVEYGRVLLGRGVPESVILDWCHDLEVKVPNPKSVLNGETNQHENGNRNERRITLWRRQQAPRSMSKSSFSYQSPFELVQNLDAKECSDKLIGLYDYELFGASEQQTKCCKFKCS